MRAIVTDKCDGAGECAATCPQVFQVGDDGRAKVRTDPVPPDAEEACREAKEMCPFQAIEIEE